VTFKERLSRSGLELRRRPTEVLQLNLGARCNQSCTHCHVKAGPARDEEMSEVVAGRCLAFLAGARGALLDLTGGAPELNPNFRTLVRSARQMGRRVLVRTNLTVFAERGCRDLPVFLAEEGAELIASLPCYTQENVDAQRGDRTYDKSIRVLKYLNDLGYGVPGSALSLTLVYNPGGAFLPGEQEALEADYRRELAERHDIKFGGLFTMTNMPIGRFADDLRGRGELTTYQTMLEENFREETASSLMCLTTVNVGWDGRLYDCDFNNALGLPLGGFSEPASIFDIAPADVIDRPIAVADHCYGCTAGAGSSCQGALTAP